MVSALKALLLSTIGDKISWDTLLTEDSSEDTFIVFKENGRKSTFAGIPSPSPLINVVPLLLRVLGNRK